MNETYIDSWHSCKKDDFNIKLSFNGFAMRISTIRFNLRDKVYIKVAYLTCSSRKLYFLILNIFTSNSFHSTFNFYTWLMLIQAQITWFLYLISTGKYENQRRVPLCHSDIAVCLAMVQCTSNCFSQCMYGAISPFVHHPSGKIGGCIKWKGISQKASLLSLSNLKTTESATLALRMYERTFEFKHAVFNRITRFYIASNTQMASSLDDFLDLFEGYRDVSSVSSLMIQWWSSSLSQACLRETANLCFSLSLVATSDSLFSKEFLPKAKNTIG